jgi:hypothetical protein
MTVARSFAGVVVVGLLVLTACSDRGSDEANNCVATAGAEVCGRVDGGALTFTGEGLDPGSVVRFEFGEQGPGELVVSEAGTLVNPPGAIGWLSFDGTFGVCTFEAVAADGTRLAGEIDPD